jgi:hypothetical protein
MGRTTSAVYGGLLLLGLILTLIGAFIEPFRVGETPGSELGETLVAFGLALVVIGIGYFLAWANPVS